MSLKTKYKMKIYKNRIIEFYWGFRGFKIVILGFGVTWLSEPYIARQLWLFGRRVINKVKSKP